MATPKPGRPVRGSHTGRPIMALLDLLGRRWTLRILWELRTASVLSQRLTELQEAGIVAHDENGDYTLTSEGKELLHALAPLQDWASSWATREMASIENRLLP